VVSSFVVAYRSRLEVVVACAILIVATLSPSPVVAHEDVRVRMLEDARGFRVRARAAIALGRAGDLAHAPALERGLSDPHPWVRAACATALGRLQAATAVPALREATRDRVARVAKQARLALSRIESSGPSVSVAATSSSPRSSAGVRYALVLGAMQNRSGSHGAEIETALAESLARQLATLEGALVLRSPAERTRAPRGIPVFRLEGTVTELVGSPSSRDVALRCVVSFLVLDDRQRTLRGTLRGAATGTEGRVVAQVNQELRVARKALDAAVRSALRNASTLIESAVTSAAVPPSAQASMIRR
jgi:hypothetical protein